jgi:hypothetical protein
VLGHELQPSCTCPKCSETRRYLHDKHHGPGPARDPLSLDKHDQAARDWLLHWADGDRLLVGAENELAHELRRAAEDATRAEREACAAICTSVERTNAPLRGYDNTVSARVAHNLAEAIMARGTGGA